MSERTYNGDPIDMAWQSDLADRDGQTVAGTTADDKGDSSTETWPSALPVGPFDSGHSGDMESLQCRIIKALVRSPDDVTNVTIADRCDCSKSQVGAVKQKVSVFVGPDAVPFDIPEQPSWEASNIVNAAMGHEAARFEADSVAGIDEDTDVADEAASDGGGDADPTAEIIARYEAGDDTKQIADDLDLSVRRVCGSLAARDSSAGDAAPTAAEGEAVDAAPDTIEVALTEAEVRTIVAGDLPAGLVETLRDRLVTRAFGGAADD